jgi:uncharacterized protein YdeI (YjbR/CyaY-like superfamily)
MIMAKPDFPNLKRPIQEMPAYVEEAINGRGLMEVYRMRPPYQQNDYLWWIKSARRPETRQKRLNQMLDELAGADKYMNMPYRSTEREKG